MHSCVAKLPRKFAADKVTAYLSYPKIAIFEDKNVIFADCAKLQEPPSYKEYPFDHDILNHILFKQNLWIVLKSFEIIVINIEREAMLTIIPNNYANYKIRDFECDGNNIFLISESGEKLKNPFTQEQLNNEFEKGTNTVTVQLEKTTTSTKQTLREPHFKSGFDILAQNSNICITCPVTGLNKILATNSELKYVKPWDDKAVFGNDLKMWAVNLKNMQKAFDFENIESNCLPLGYYSDSFYFILWGNETINVHKTLKRKDKETNQCIEKGTGSSQESLKLQLKAVQQEVLTQINQPEQFLPQLQMLFKDIDDSSFLLNVATKLCQHDIIYKSLLFSIQKKVFNTEDKKLISSYLDLNIKIDLLEYIYFRSVNQVLNKNYDDVNIFDKNCFELCQLFVSKSDLDLASICWLKYSKIDIKIDPENIVKILNATPPNIKLGTLTIWLRNFIPAFTDNNPFHIDLISKWAIERIFLFEQSPFWPKIGVKYIEAIIDVLESSLKTIIIRPISIDELDKLRNHVKYIMELKEKYKINMLISEISSQSPIEVALIMLRRCYTEDLKKFIDENLSAYANQHQFDLDETVCSFIEIQTASGGGDVDGERLQILLDAIHSPTSKLNCLLRVLKLLDVPWDSTVLSLAKKAAALSFTDFTLTNTDRAISEEIHKEISYAKIRVVLKKYNFPINFSNFILVIHKVINSTVIDLSDLKTITDAIPAYRHYANVTYIDKCLRECETKAALEYYRSLSNKDQKMVIKSVENKYEHIITGVSNNTLERNYLDFLKGTHHLPTAKENVVEKMYYLKNSFGVKSCLNEIFKEDSNKLINMKCETSSADIDYSKNINTEYVSQPQYSNLEILLHQSSTVNQIRTVIKQLIMLHSNNESNCELLVNQLKNIDSAQLILDSHCALSNIIWNCQEEYLHLLVDIISILNAIINTNIIFKNLALTWKFNYIFLPMSSVSTVNNLIDIYLDNKAKTTIDVPNIFNSSDFMPLRIIAYATIQEKILGTRCDDIIIHRDKIARKLITKVIASQDLDQVLLTSLLLLSNDLMEDKFGIVELLRGQTDNLAPSAVYYLSCQPIQQCFGLEGVVPGSSLSYPPQYILKSKFNINLAEIALPDCTEETWDVKVLLFYILRQYPNTNFDRLVELCNALNVCVNDGLSLLLISLLTNWELEYKVHEDDLGCRKIILNNSEHDLISKCLIIWQNIMKKEFLIDVLNDFWKNGEVVIHGCLISINPYFYEVLLCIYHILKYTTSEIKHTKEYLILNFLKEYQRKSSPKQYEFELFSVKGLFPEIGHYRLPFHLFLREDMWSNLKSEITLETYERWLPIVALLSLDANIQTAKDMICSNAVKQTMTSRKPSSEVENKDNESWKLTSNEEPLLRTAHKCVKHISNMEWAGACLFYVLQGCAQGADQVAAAQLCYQFSQRWAAIQPGNRAVRQMERLHSNLSTRHVLHKMNWACEEFIRLTSEPTQLIHALYLHPIFVEKIGRNNINKATNEIADINCININTIRIQILENLLDKNKKDNEATLNINELITAKYILKATCSKMGAIYLSRIAFDDENEQNKLKKLRALQCFMSVVQEDISVKVTNKERSKLWLNALDLLHTVLLERIDMPWVISNFRVNKNAALIQLVQAYGGRVDVLKVAAELANKFGDFKIIRELIPLLLRFSLHEEMIPLLLKLSLPPDSVICSAWRAIILSPFQKADYPITEKQKTNCINALNLLPLCPIVKDEDLIDMWKNCVRCKCIGLGCLILPYMTVETRQRLVELNRIDKRNLIIGLKNLHADTYLASSAMCVIETMSRKVGKK
ncbi:uncharacterized protein LOC126969348 [Leptidea sinapis]|uniref:uncharacterized protein LOC126969348 n=1 Tax=Leptidea sinapis TaxID=189913 RepID=UPI0021C29579|nr:uncharacterized protein LOC126969348 [Leptidea sinapis]